MMKRPMILIILAITLPLLVDGNTRPSSCNDIQLQVGILRGEYESITNNITIYRQIDTDNFIMKCQCINNKNVTPTWTLPSDDLLGSSDCKHNRICPMNQTLSFPPLKRLYSGYYKCHINSISIGFNLLVIGLPLFQKPSPNDQLVPLMINSHVILHCTPTWDGGSLIYYWEKKDLENWITVDSNNRTSYTTNTTGQYRCNVTNEVGSVISPVITVYGRPPVFLTHPNSHIVTVGMTVSLYCNASGSGVSYGWEMRSSNSGSWSSVNDNKNYYIYDVRNIQQSKQYRCVAGNDLGTVASNAATIQVLNITSHPQNRHTPIGSTVRLTCTSSISSHVTFSWTHNGTNVRRTHLLISGATSRLTIRNVRYSDGGSYVCIVKRGSLSVTSNTATITVYGPPVIKYPQHHYKIPVNKTSNATLQCRAAGYGSLTYFWEKNISGNWIKINSINMTSYTTNTSGQYRCNVTNGARSDLSPVITVYGPPVFFTHPKSQIVIAGMNVSLYCNVSGFVGSRDWEMRRNNRSLWSRVNNRNKYKYDVRNIQQSKQYRCVAGNDAGSVASEVATIQILRIKSHPHNRQISIGSTVTLTCTSSISSDVTFSWTHNNTNIERAYSIIMNSTTNTLTISNVRYSDGGSYVCIVKNGSLSVTSNTATITVYGSPVFLTHPTSHIVTVGMTVSLYCNVSGIIGSQHWEMRRNNRGSWSRISNSNNYKYDVRKIQQSKQYRCVASNSAGSVTSKTATIQILKINSHPHNTQISIDSNVTLYCTSSISSHVTFSWTHNGTNVNRTHISISGATSKLTKSNVRYSDGGSYMCIVKRGSLSVTSSTATVTVYGPPVFLTHPKRHIVTVGMTVSLYCNVSGTVKLYGWEMRSTNGDSWSKISNSNNSKYDVKDIQQSKQYRCVAGNEAGSVTSKAATIQILKITSHPQNRRTPIGSNVTLTCTSSISSRVTFSWTHNGTKVGRKHLSSSGATNTLTISNVRYSDGGSYVCIVKRGLLSVTSNTATITVYDVPKPVIKTHPVSSKVKALTRASFTCSVSNINGMTHSYSWHRNNSDIPSTRSRGQNTNTLTITRAIPPDEGMYYCIATNDGGSTSSRSASLTVDDELSIIVNPLIQTVSEGGVATFIANATGIKTREFEYEWFKFEKPKSITVGKNRRLNINNVRVENEGLYYSCAKNEWNNLKCSPKVNLTINATPSVFTIHPQDQFIYNKEVAVFECAANGSDTLMITWTKNDELIQNSSLNEITHSGKKSILKIKKATVDSSGVYLCVATNADNEVVISKPAELLILPSMNTYPDNVTVLTGQSVNLTCSATGTDVVYQWMWNGVIISDDNSNVLRINEIKQSDDGTYQCIASNKGGNATSNPAMIIVYDKPSVIPFPSQILGVLSEQFQITCNATNDKDAPHNMMFTWMAPDGVNDNIKITSKDDDHTASSTLYISRLARSDNGTYKCYVTNNNDSSASVVTSTTVIVEERPSQPLNFSATTEGDTSLKLSWSEPVNSNGEIDYYTIYYSDGKTPKTVNVYNFTGSYVLEDLTPSTQYNIYVTAVRLIGEKNEILEGNISIVANATTLDNSSTSQSGGGIAGIAIGIVAALVLIIIIITFISVIYFCKRKQYLKHDVFANAIATKDSIDLKDKAFGNDEEKKPLPVNHRSPPQSSINSSTEIMPVINAMYSAEVQTSVGQPTTLLLEVPDVMEENVTWFKDGQQSTHAVLKDGSLYISHTELSDQGEYTVMVKTDDDISSKAYTVLAADPQMPLDDSINHKVIKVEDFPEHVSLLKSGDKSNLTAEYETLKVNATFTQHAAKMSINIAKNRYKNIVAYDHSRVVLSQEKYTAGEDYINASFIEGYGESKAYIASQGPMRTNFEDFWRMIWEQNVRTIVMLSKLVEDGKYKCDQYWPDSGFKLYGNIRVTAENIVQFANYCVRRFSIEHVSNDRNFKRKVHQFHFNSWPDHGVPIYPTSILDIQKRIDKHHKRRTGSPMLVHCSAGVGRTGTFIAIDTEVQRIRQEGIMDVYNCVQKMRYCRNSMIQTLPQYEFVYTALLEFIICGDTSIAGAETLKQKIIDLSYTDYSVNKTGFQLQYEKLNNISPKETDFQYTVATSNKKKNRQQKFLPPDSSRVILGEKNGYINACFINGYRQNKAFLVGPGPMKSTVVDFWQMIWENKCYAIVLLGQLLENKKEASFKYWPNKEESITFGNFSVELESDDPENKFLIKRTVKVTNVKEKPSSSRTITLLQYQDWASQSCPENPVHIIDLIEKLECDQRKTGNNAIAVHCSDGAGRSGTFCALFNCVSRFKAEQVVDVFQTIKSMRTQNPAVVQTAEQYEFIHQVIVILTERYATYANFTLL